MTKTMLIVGASGVIGAAAVELLGRMPDWRVIAMSRRAPRVAADVKFEHVSLDLRDPAAAAPPRLAWPASPTLSSPLSSRNPA